MIWVHIHAYIIYHIEPATRVPAVCRMSLPSFPLLLIFLLLALVIVLAGPISNLQSASFNVQLFCSLITADTCPAKHSTNLLCKARHGPFTIFLAAMMRAQRFKEGTNAVNYICIDTSRVGGVLGDSCWKRSILEHQHCNLLGASRITRPSPIQFIIDLPC